MTANPRALEIGRLVLEQITPEISENIRHAGKLLIQGFSKLQQRYPAAITKVQGTGLLLSVEFSANYKVYGSSSLEEQLRKNGINVIHGGINSLRFTPVFTISESEIDLLVSVVEQAVQEYCN
jgi:4-aminobutyrate aminotransferase-like enzyme